MTGDQTIEVGEIHGFFKSLRADVFDADFDDEQENYRPPAEQIRQWLSGAVARQADKLTKDDLADLDRFVRL